jgi:energy-coupling factor transporter ATP-binding protein EcfA2
MDVRHLRNHISVVSQNPHLFDATVSENIAYGTDGLPHGDIERAALLANVHEFVESLPQGYSTMVGENASLISGGQAQRLQIARALVRPADVLILDECTSALDGANQAAVLTTVLGAKAGRTTIMITHKLPVMRMCDRILVVHEGKVAEQGTYEELIAHKGVFAQLASGRDDPASCLIFVFPLDPDWIGISCVCYTPLAPTRSTSELTYRTLRFDIHSLKIILFLLYQYARQHLHCFIRYHYCDIIEYLQRMERFCMTQSICTFSFSPTN